MERLFRLLKADEIDVKVKQVKAKGAIALIYKTSRVDMDILDETLGEENWTTDYKEIKGNLYCGIGIRKEETKPFIWKWDCGIESREDDEGNEKKGEASDAFKRAGFKVGIGRELYTAPFIFLNVETEADGKKYKLKNPFDSYSVSKIKYDESNKISVLEIVNSERKTVFSFPRRNASVNPSESGPQPGKASVKQPTLPTASQSSAASKKVQITPERRAPAGKLTRSELVQTWGVTNAEETIAWLEQRIGYIYEDWTDDEHKLARDFVKAAAEKRKAETEKMRRALQKADGELPFAE